MDRRINTDAVIKPQYIKLNRKEENFTERSKVNKNCSQMTLVNFEINIVDTEKGRPIIKTKETEKVISQANPLNPHLVGNVVYLTEIDSSYEEDRSRDL